IGFRGFKSIAFVATASETVHAVDTDFGAPLWKYHINYSASPPPIKGYSADCPGGLTAALSRPTAIAPAAAGAAEGGGRGGRSGGGVGEPGKGSLTLATAGQRGAGARGAAPAAVPPGTAPGSAAAAAGVVPGALPGGARGGGPGGGGPFAPGGDAAYVVGSDGYLHALNVQNGWESMTPALFLPANTRATGLLIATSADGGAVAYAATTRGCSSQPDAVWAMDLASPQKTVNAFQARGAIIAGTAGPAFGRDGSVYIVTTDGKSPLSNAVVALEPRTLTLKGSVTVPRANFAASPLIFQSSDTDILVAAGGGKLLLFDTRSLSNGPIATSAAYGPAGFEPGALASWQDAQGVRWIAAPSSRGIVTMKITEQDGKLAFLPGWTSRDIAAPLPPLVLNGVMFAVSGGTRTAPGVLYAIDAATGKDLWNSARTITSTVRGGLSGGQGNVYVPATDGTLYAFGFAIEK
ncbi:MAG TPA: PQQ-binding-like beta-propeller repeat protein, partial [Vicinamibacterales bacterium]|nr:PQQ-binding-like beta-propeller repeat protein [Vicinamibacterales bacterium]